MQPARASGPSTTSRRSSIPSAGGGPRYRQPHTPFWQVCPSGQGLSQPPQCSGSVFGLTHWSPHLVPELQSHLESMHDRSPVQAGEPPCEQPPQ